MKAEREGRGIIDLEKWADFFYGWPLGQCLDVPFYTISSLRHQLLHLRILRLLGRVRLLSLSIKIWNGLGRLGS